MNKGALIIGVLSVMLTARLGTVVYNGHKEFWYNRPMHNVVEKAQKNGYDEPYWERKDGCKMIGKYIICAGAEDRYGEVIETSRGLGMILDTGDFAKKDPTAIDMAVTW